MSERNIQKNIPELLSPAGSPAALRAAIAAGADAVYFAMPEFNARIGADNFTPDSFAEGVELCHISGVRAYITLNTQLYDRERAEFLRTAEKAYLSGADAAIVGDLGGAALIRKYIPEFEIHASTQLSGHCADAGIELSKLGFSRMVCAREMSLDDIRTFTEKSPIEAEIFIHGALCVCHSGQCLFSSLVGGRSGNRGLCAQPCRLPYKTGKGKNDYPLSLKDMALASHITEIIDSGVASLKIEGRMKPADYVYRVTGIYRRLLDEGRNASREELRELSCAFSRGGSFTDSYFTGRAGGELGSGMLGVRTDADKARSKDSAVRIEDTRKARLSLSADIRRDKPMKLTLTLCEGDVGRFKGVNDPSVTVFGDIPVEAMNRPTAHQTILDNLSKFGGTPFISEGGSISFDEGLLIPHSSLNALRRKAVDALTERILEPYRQRKPHVLPDLIETVTPSMSKKTALQGGRAAIFYDTRAITQRAEKYFDLIWLPLSAYESSPEKLAQRGGVYGVMLPPVIFDSELERAEKAVSRAYGVGVRHIMIENIGQLPLAKRSGMTVHGGMRLGISNSDTASVISSFGVSDMILSPELTLPRLRDISRAFPESGAIVYGRVPLMVTEKCLIRELSSCAECKKSGGNATLTDRTGASFPVKREFGHRSLIFNSQPTYTADNSDKLPPLGVRLFIFTTENGTEVDGIIESYEKGLPYRGGKIRRI